MDCLLETLLWHTSTAVYHLKVPQTIVGRLNTKEKGVKKRATNQLKFQFTNFQF